MLAGVAPTLLALRFRIPGSFLRLFSSELLPAPALSGPNSQALFALPARFSPLQKFGVGELAVEGLVEGMMFTLGGGWGTLKIRQTERYQLFRDNFLKQSLPNLSADLALRSFCAKKFGVPLLTTPPALSIHSTSAPASPCILNKVGFNSD